MRDNCACCGSDEYNFITDKLRYDKKGIVAECVKCGLIRLLGAKNFEDKSEEYYRKKYAKEYHKGVKANLDSLFDSFLPVQEERIGRMRKFFRKTDRLLEIGSSVGYFLYSAKKYVAEVYGIELNIEEAEYANDKKKIKTSHKSLENSEFNSMKFDHICLFQLLEHIPDPILFLRELRKYLRPGGYIHIEVPNIADPLVSLFDNMEFRNFFYQKPHLYYFSPRTLTNIAKKSGLKIIAIEPFQQTSITNSLNWIYCKWPQPSRRDCIQASLPTRYVSSRKTRRAQKEIHNFLQEINMAYKKVLLKNNFADNIFCTLRLSE